jgi:hypothetical protein
MSDFREYGIRYNSNSNSAGTRKFGGLVYLAVPLLLFFVFKSNVEAALTSAPHSVSNASFALTNKPVTATSAPTLTPNASTIRDLNNQAPALRYIMPPATNPVAVSADTNTAKGPSQLPDIIPAGSINMILELPQFLQFYASFTEAVPDTSQLGKLPPAIIRFKNTNHVTRSEALQLLDKVLYDQAGIVVTHPDTKHVVFKLRSAVEKK